MDEIKLKATACDRAIEYIDSIIKVLETGKGRIHDKVSELKAVPGMSSCGINSSVFDGDIEELKKLLKNAKETVENIRKDITGYSKETNNTNNNLGLSFGAGQLTALNAQLNGVKDSLIKRLKTLGYKDQQISLIVTSIASSTVAPTDVKSYQQLINKYSDTLKKYSSSSNNDKTLTSLQEEPKKSVLTEEPVSSVSSPSSNITQTDNNQNNWNPTPVPTRQEEPTPVDNPVDDTPIDAKDGPTPPIDNTPVEPTPQPVVDPTPVNTEPAPQPVINTTPAPSQSYNNYNGGVNNNVEVLTPKEEEIPITPEIIDVIEKGNKYTKIPTSTVEKVTSTNESGGNSVIPILAGISAAAAAGVGAKAYMDRKSNTDNNSADFAVSEWNEDKEDGNKYIASSNNELYEYNDNSLSDDYSYQEPEVEKYESRSNNELSDMQ